MGRRVVWNGGISGQTSTAIMGRMRDESARFGRSYAVWAGRNNYTDPTTVKANIATMVGIAGTFSESRYVVLSVLNKFDGSENSGSSPWTTITTLNSDLATLYPGNYIDIRTLLVAQGGPGMPYADAVSFAADIIPPGLRGDALVHLNDAGYAVVADAVYDFFVAKRWALPLAA